MTHSDDGSEEPVKGVFTIESVTSCFISPSEVLLSTIRRRLLRLSLVATFLIAMYFAVLLFKADHASPPRKALVLSSHAGQDLSWVKEVPKDWEVYSYETGNPNAPLPVPSKQGREAITYITFIVDHYDDLPDYTIFLHGHSTSWHQPQSILAKIQALNLSAVTQDGYVSFRCWQFPGCTPESYVNMSAPERDPIRLATLTPGFFNYAFAGDTAEKLPEAFGAPCCAQFAVTKRAIRTRSLHFWRRLQQPMLEGDLAKYSNSEEILDDWVVGALFEHMWHYFFGKGAIDCQTESYCREVVFSNKVHCEDKGGPFFESVAFRYDPNGVECWYGEG